MVSTSYHGDHSNVADPAKTAPAPRPERLTRSQQDDLIAWAKVWHDAGCAVHPSKVDGSKYAVAVRHGSPDRQPDVFPDTYQSGRLAGMPHPRAGQANPEAGQYGYGWGRIKDGEMPPLTVDQIAAFIRGGKSDGIGIICGRVSGGVFMLEAEGRARGLLPKVREAAERLGHLHLLERLAAGCVDESPSGGLHFYLRADDGIGPGNVVLAARPAQSAEQGRDVLFETRGHGGWSVVAPSAGRTHKNGKPYRFVRGGPSTIPTFTQDEISSLFDIFRAVDEMPVQPVVERQPAKPVQFTNDDGLKPGDDFNQRASWDDILTGWKKGQTVGDRTHWIRPGKSHGTSATTTADVLCCFSSNTPLPQFNNSTGDNALSKFATYAHLNHGGDFSAAARDLWDRGYGSRGNDGGPADDRPVPVEPRPMPAGDCRTLDDWRAEVAERRAVAVRQPGMHMDRSPTGSGKTHATIAALRQASSSLTVLPTHANVVERVQEMQAQGLPAVAFPELTPDTCQQFDLASQARSLGIGVGAAVCPGCPFNRIPNPRYPGLKANGKQEPKTLPGPCHGADQYLGMMKEASQADHRVGTHERLRRSSRAAEGVKVVVIDETPEAVVAPTLTVSVRQLGAVDHLAHGIRHYWHSEATVDQKAFAAAMQGVVAAIHTACSGATTAGTVQVELPQGHTVPDNWQRLLMDSIRQVGVGDDLDAEALTLVTKAAAGELLTLEVVTDLTRTNRLMHFVVGSWRPALPADAAVILLDATGNADDIAAVVGQPVNDCTPAGHLPTQQRVVQIDTDISKGGNSRKGGTSAATVAGLIDAFLSDHPEVQRLGIIGHQPHIKALIDGGELGAASRSRLAKWCWFGQGPDRASNDWHQACDHLLVLGTPRANPGTYRRWLVQHGLHAAAGKVDGDWGAKDWEAVTVDGVPTTVHGAGYRDADWHRAYTAVCRSTLHQVVGRGRPILPDGIPVTILSNEPTQYPVAPSLTTTPAAARETVEILLGMGSQTAPSLPGLCAKSPIGDSYRGFCASGPWPTATCVQAIMAAAGINRRAAEVRLAQCREAGLLTRPKRGWWAIAGAESVPVPEAPPSTPRPAEVSLTAPAVVITATGPVAPAPTMDVVADRTTDTTTTTCTSTVQPADAPEFDDLLALIDERAAIIEFDGGLDRETAERLAREMVLGRDQPAPQIDNDDAIVVAADHAGLAVRSQPFVGQVLGRLTGTVRLIDDRDDPFAGQRHRQQPRHPGACQCGQSDWVHVPIHGGKSIRVDCRHCDRFGWFGVWYGKRLPGPSPEAPAPTSGEPRQQTNRLSFLAMSPPPMPLVAAG